MKSTARIIMGLLLLALSALPATAADLSGAVASAVTQATAALGPLDDPAASACLTNAGYAAWQGQGTLAVLDELPKHAAVSVGRGNLLVRPSRANEPLYFFFIKKTGPEKLAACMVRADGPEPKAEPPLDIHIGVGTSFEPFKKALGPMAFNLVSLANGWAMGLPTDMMRAALWHGHLCCGVFTGWFTARFIEQNIALEPGERLLYVGAPAWCQDDYIMDYLRLTPGTHGYVTMSFPWSKSWPTAEKNYDMLGGVVVRWDPKAKKGTAYVLRFDWHWDAFKAFIGQPGLKLDWPKEPWLHKAYDRFFMSKMAGGPAYFVSIHKQVALDSEADYQAVVSLGANPLAKLLGPRVD